jgi:Phage integrase, N-terminal SAM-like domain
MFRYMLAVRPRIDGQDSSQSEARHQIRARSLSDGANLTGARSHQAARSVIGELVRRAERGLQKLRLAGGGRWLHALGPADDGLEVGPDVLTFTEAQKKARQWLVKEARKATGAPEPSQALTVAEVVSAYLDWTKKHRTPTTAREWRYMANAHILPALGKLKVAKLTIARLRMWHENLAEQPGRLRTRRGEQQRYRQRDDDPDAIRPDGHRQSQSHGPESCPESGVAGRQDRRQRELTTGSRHMLGGVDPERR